MPKRRTNTRRPTKSGPRINKSAWIRAQDSAIPAKDLVVKAAADGISLSVAQVYTARSTAKTSPSTPKRARSLNGRSRDVGSDNAAQSFRRLVLTLGTDKAESLLAEIKKARGSKARREFASVVSHRVASHGEATRAERREPGAISERLSEAAETRPTSCADEGSSGKGLRHRRPIAAHREAYASIVRDPLLTGSFQLSASDRAVGRSPSTAPRNKPIAALRA
jgi:hypothetical protein